MSGNVVRIHESHSYATGNVVQLKSGGCRMTVETVEDNVDEDGDPCQTVYCQWLDTVGVLHEGAFFDAQLILIEE